MRSKIALLFAIAWIGQATSHAQGPSPAQSPGTHGVAATPRTLTHKGGRPAPYAHEGASPLAAGSGITTQDLTAGLTVLDLAQTLVGPGILVSNATSNLSPTAAGLFDSALIPIGMSSGIVLSSGNIATVVGPNLVDDASTSYDLPGDPDLDGLVPGYSTEDACVIEFDFIDPSVLPGVSAGVQFQYVFTSEEYNEYVDSPFNDVFGFFLNGQNIAVLPSDLTTPVSINNVNCGNPYSPPGGANCSFYINNDLSDGGGAINTEMDGLLIPLSAVGTVIGPGPHHLKLALADAGDWVLDSNVFIQRQGLVVQEEPSCIAPTPAIDLGAEPVEALVGAPVTYPVVAISNDTAGTPRVTITGVTAEHSAVCGAFSSVPVPAGVAHVPALPVSGQPAQTTFSWTPSVLDLGCWRFIYTLQDQNGLTHDCTVVVRVVSTESCTTLGFETEDDFTTPIGNGQALTTPPEFGGFVRVSAAGPNLGLVAFDSTPGGPNSGSADTDMLIDRGNLLMLQDTSFPAQTTPGYFDRPVDDPDGGDLIFDFISPTEPQSIALIDLDPFPNRGATVTLVDSEDRTRVYAVPAGWTGSFLSLPGWKLLDLTTTSGQIGNAPGHWIATATEDPEFDPFDVVRIAVHLTGFGAIDDLTVCAPSLRAAVLPRNGSGVNHVSLANAARPVIGRAWTAELDCSSFGTGVAILSVRNQELPGVPTPFGELLINGTLLHRDVRPFNGSATLLSWNIPSNVALVGLSVHAQGLCRSYSVGSSGALEVNGGLSNALDLKLGF